MKSWPSSLKISINKIGTQTLGDLVSKSYGINCTKCQEFDEVKSAYLRVKMRTPSKPKLIYYCNNGKLESNFDLAGESPVVGDDCILI